jgi:hypothetical protein
MHYLGISPPMPSYLLILSKPWIDVTVKGMAKELVTDELWETIEPLLPCEPPKPKGCLLL